VAELDGLGFGGLLRRLRHDAGLTQEELAAVAQVSQRAVSDLERGINHTARRDTAALLAEALDLAEPIRSMFVAAARGQVPAADVLAALPRQAPASVAAAGGVHGFPAPLTSFIGRAEPQREIAGLLTDHRLVTVAGPGGAGKTRLAVQVARQVAGEFADGAWLVELAAVADPAQVAAVVAAALEVREQPGLPASEALIRALARQQVLLLLDNCEHVIGAAAALCAGLLAVCDDVRVLATSREPLRVAGEARYRLASLALQDLDDLAEAARAEAVALFADRPGGRAPGDPAGRDAAGDRAGGGAGRSAGRDRAAGPARRAAGPAGRRGPAGPVTAAVAGGDRGVELPASGRGRAAGIPGGIGVSLGVHPGRRRGGRGGSGRAGGAAAGGLLAADPAAGRP
jgi:transcriptional regulator with XRE-family HTH domain